MEKPFSLSGVVYDARGKALTIAERHATPAALYGAFEALQNSPEYDLTVAVTVGQTTKRQNFRKITKSVN